jgi:hypothetical protein
MWLNILRNFLFSTLYLLRLDLQEQEISLDHEQHYKVVGTDTEQYKVVMYYSMVCTNAALCHTKYAQVLL